MKSDMEDGAQSTPARLNGWKEIAGYLGKSVRTAQRWEKDLGMPVHRIHTGGGEIPFAFRQEIDRWLTSTESERADSVTGNGENGEPAPGPLASAIPAAPAQSRAPLLRRLGFPSLLAVGLVLLLALWFGRDDWLLRLFAGPAPQPAAWTVEGGRLKVFDDGDELLWEYEFGRPLLDASYALGAGTPRDQSVFIADLEGDGNREVGIIAWAEPGPHPNFYVLNHDGALRFTLQPGRTVQFGAKLYASPWLPSQLLLTDEGDGSKVLWVVFRHNLEFPAPIQKISPQGEVLGEYWSNGHIATLREGVFQGRRAIFAGGTNNEHYAASLAVLDYADPAGSSPAENTKYLCVDCPSGNPVAFWVFPRMELSRLMNSRPIARDMRLDGAGNLILNVDQVEDDPAVSRLVGTAFYALSPGGQVLEAETGDMYRQLHSRFESRKRIDHPFGIKCEKQLFPVLRWDHARQRFVPEHGRLGAPPR